MGARSKRPSRSGAAAARRGSAACPPRGRGIDIRCPSAVSSPSVVAHLGPTNSGKTYDALRFLAEHGRGVYAGARMLAQEAHRRLSAELGPNRVGLVTGEARERARTDHLLHGRDGTKRRGRGARARRGAVGGRRGARLRLDADAARRRLPPRCCWARSTRCARPGAFPRVEVRLFERKLPLEFVGARARSLAAGTVVVAFSRRGVLALAGEVNRLRRAGRSPLRPCRWPRAAGDRSVSRAAPRCASPPTCSGMASTCPARRFSSPRPRSSTAGAPRPAPPGSWRRSPAAPGASAWSSAATSGCSPASPGPWPIRSSSSRRCRNRTLPAGGHLGYRVVDEARIRPRLGDLGVDPARPRRRARRLVPRRDAGMGHELARRFGHLVRLRWTRCSGGSPPAGVASLETRGRSSRRRSTRIVSSCSGRWPSPSRATRRRAASWRRSSTRAGCGTRRSRTPRRRARRQHPALVRAPVPRRGRRHDRAGDSVGGGRGSARGRAPAARGERADDRALPLVRANLRYVVPPVRPLLRPCAHVIETRREPRGASRGAPLRRNERGGTGARRRRRRRARRRPRRCSRRPTRLGDVRDPRRGGHGRVTSRPDHAGRGTSSASSHSSSRTRAASRVCGRRRTFAASRSRGTTFSRSPRRADVHARAVRELARRLYLYAR